MKRNHKRTEEQEQNFRDLTDAIQAIREKLNPQTLGPCDYCGWPITRIFQGPAENMKATCDLCDRFCDTLVGKREFWNEYAANVI